MLAEIKARTTEDVTSGVLTALRGVLGGGGTFGVVIGTTHFTNAVLTGSGLARAAAGPGGPAGQRDSYGIERSTKFRCFPRGHRLWDWYRNARGRRRLTNEHCHKFAIEARNTPRGPGCR